MVDSLVTSTSAITSNKTITKGHIDRFEFANELKYYFGDKVELFGNGVNNIADKWDALKNFKYHVVIENSSYKHYWTEKLADCFLAGTYPFYYGCKNIYDYFPDDSLTEIDIYDRRESFRIIEEGINENIFESSFSGLKKAKELVLNKYNLFPVIESLTHDQKFGKKKLITIKPQANTLSASVNLKKYAKKIFKKFNIEI